MAHVISARVSLPGGGWLDLNDGTYFTVTRWAPGGRAFRKRTSEGTFTRGRTVLGMVRDAEQSTLTVKVAGGSAAALETNTTSLFDAFSQFAYTLEITINGVLTTLTCEAADQIIYAKGEWDKYSAARALPAQTFAVTFSHDPV